ncbi:MAG: hypothetical protein PHV10_05340 [Sulfuricurvum sp.]|nr:hypothetical protein [Sulfuricurvum sp.]
MLWAICSTTISGERFEFFARGGRGDQQRVFVHGEFIEGAAAHLLGKLAQQFGNAFEKLVTDLMAVKAVDFPETVNV